MSESSLFGLLIMSFGTIIVLGGIVVKQKQTISDFKTPKYGFLGKKLSMYILGVCAFGVFSLVLYPRPTEIDTSISVSDTTEEVRIQIIQNLVNSEEQTYELIAVPQINGIDWQDGNSLFEVSWIVNERAYSEIVSKENPGGILVMLDSGTNKITASIWYLGQIYFQDIVIEI